MQNPWIGDCATEPGQDLLKVPDVQLWVKNVSSRAADLLHGVASVDEATQRLQAAGFSGHMRVSRSADLECGACGKVRPPEEVTIQARLRVEGQSDPGETSIVVALECLCGARACLAFAYGAGADAMEMEALGRMRDAATGST